jgi:YidC/Oxa1 family membrane protein insertase
MNFFDLILVQPLLNILVTVYSLVPFHDFGIAIIILTLIIRGILWPLQSQTLRSQKALQKIQPEIKKISEKYKNDPQKVQQMTMELYKEKEVNPLSSCLPSLIQLPLLFALYYAIIKFSSPAFLKLADPHAGIWNYLYPWVRDLGFVKTALTGTFNTSFIGIFNLSQKAFVSLSPFVVKPEIIIAIAASVAQYFQVKMMTPKQEPGDSQAQMMNSLTLLMPLMILYIGLILPAALPLYWLATTAVAAFQQWLIMGHDVEELDKEAAIEVAARSKDQTGGKPTKRSKK